MINNYNVNLANPKSAILAFPLCMNTLATLRSLCMTFCSAKYNNPSNISLMMGYAVYSLKYPFFLSLVYKSP